MRKPVMPNDLNPAGQQAWEAGFQQLEEIGGYKSIHYHSLYCYCKCIDVIVDGYSQLEELQVEHKNNKSKTNQRKSPVWAVIAEAQREQRAYSAKLGFTPLDESKIPVKAKEEEDELELMLQGAGVIRK